MDDNQLLIDYKVVFDSEAGKRVLDNLREKFHFDRAYVKYNGLGDISIYEMMRYEGYRGVIVYILTQIGKDPYAEKQERTITKRPIEREF